MKPKAVAENDDARMRLLEEGARSYLEATTAIITFEREIQKKCRELLESNIADYSDALRAPEILDSEEIQDWLWPSMEKFDGLSRSVGVAIQGKRFEPFVKWWGTYCTLDWEENDCYASVCEWIGGPWIKSEQLFQTLQKTGVETYNSTSRTGLFHNEKNVGLCQLINVENAQRFEEPLERALLQWIKLWKKIGGLKGVFK